MTVNGTVILKAQLGKEIACKKQLSKFVFDVRTFENFNGGTATYADVDVEAGLKYFRLVPWANAVDLAAGEYFDVEYVGFFKTEKAAREYKHTVKDAKSFT